MRTLLDLAIGVAAFNAGVAVGYAWRALWQGKDWRDANGPDRDA